MPEDYIDDTVPFTELVPEPEVPLQFIPPVRKKFPLLLSLLLVLLVFMASISIYLFVQMRALNTQLTASPTPSPFASTDPTASWQTYIDPNNLFTFMYPEDWKVGEYNGSYYLTPISKTDITKPTIIFNQINSKLSIPEYEKKLSSEGPSPNMYSKYTVEKKVGEIVGYYREDSGCEPTLCDQFHMSKDNKIYSFLSLYYEGVDLSQRAIYNQILSTFKFTSESLPIITLPAPDSIAKSPLVINGIVPSGWMFEGQFPIEIYDSSGKVIGTGIGKDVPPGSWSSGKDINFSSTIAFETDDKVGYILLLSDNPSGIPENQLVFRENIKF